MARKYVVMIRDLHDDQVVGRLTLERVKTEADATAEARRLKSGLASHYGVRLFWNNQQQSDEVKL